MPLNVACRFGEAASDFEMIHLFPFFFSQRVLFFVQFLFDRMLTGLVLDSGSILQKMQDITCHKNTHRASFCRDLIFQFIGANPANFNLVTQSHPSKR